jgi:hypothetical protein
LTPDEERNAMSMMRWILAAAVAALLAGCSGASMARRDSDRHAAYVAAAGAPARSFRFFSLYSWEPLGDRALAVYTRPNKAWLLDLAGPCPELPFANTIGLTSNINEVSVRFDKVLTGRREFPCPIAQIRPVDVTRLKAVQQAQREIRSQPRSPADTSGH